MFEDGSKPGMVELVETRTDRVNGVTLVTGVVRNTRSTVQSVRITSTFDGGTWVPRDGHRGIPEWTDGDWEGVLAPGERRGLGFATPSSPPASDRPPLELVDSSRVDERVGEDSPLTARNPGTPPEDVLPGDA